MSQGRKEEKKGWQRRKEKGGMEEQRERNGEKRKEEEKEGRREGKKAGEVIERVLLRRGKESGHGRKETAGRALFPLMPQLS